MLTSRRSNVHLPPLIGLTLLLTTVLASTLQHQQPDIATQLGWRRDHRLACGGDYQHHLIPYTPSAWQALRQQQLSIKAQHIDVPLEGAIQLHGHVCLSQPERQLQANHITLSRSHAGKLQQAQLDGHVRLEQPGQLLLGSRAHINIRDGRGWVDNVLYRLHRHRSPEPAWGQATRIEATSPQHFTIVDGTYSTCPPETPPSWQLAATRMTLDVERGRGFAKHMQLRLRGWPVFYLPYLSFPLDKRRKTGLLYPLVSYSHHSGAGLQIPFYLNLAPQIDMTLMPEYLSKRGWHHQLALRYLDHDNAGTFELGYLHHDRAFADFIHHHDTAYAQQPWYDRLIHASPERYSFAWQHRWHFDSHWSGELALHAVSDDYYDQDFNLPHATGENHNQLPRSLQLHYNDEHWQVDVGLLGFQTLHPVNQDNVTNQFKQLPHVQAEGHYDDFFGAWPYSIDLALQFDHFQHVDDTTLYPQAQIAEGQRYAIAPTFTVHWHHPWGSIEPGMTLDTLTYNVTNMHNGIATSPSRVTPMLHVDSQLFFEKTWQWRHQAYRQTFEPRGLYLYVPYRNQQNLPLFDTAQPSFTVDTVFAHNRFSGVDRLTATHQLGFGLTSNLFADREQRLLASFALGQILYFQDRRVTLCATPGCISAENPDYQASTSPLAASVHLTLQPAWDVLGQIAWQPDRGAWIHQHFAVHYHKNYAELVGIGYNDSRADDSIYPTIDQAPHEVMREGYISLSWPIASQTYALARWNYDVRASRTKTYFYGLEHHACCWAVRLVVNRRQLGLDGVNSATNRYDTAYYLQWQLKGLGSVGNRSAGDFLKQVIQGYQDQFQ